MLEHLDLPTIEWLSAAFLGLLDEKAFHIRRWACRNLVVIGRRLPLAHRRQLAGRLPTLLADHRSEVRLQAIRLVETFEPYLSSTEVQPVAKPLLRAAEASGLQWPALGAFASVFSRLAPEERTLLLRELLERPGKGPPGPPSVGERALAQIWRDVTEAEWEQVGAALATRLESSGGDAGWILFPLVRRAVPSLDLEARQRAVRALVRHVFNKESDHHPATGRLDNARLLAEMADSFDPRLAAELADLALAQRGSESPGVRESLQILLSALGPRLDQRLREEAYDALLTLRNDPFDRIRNLAWYRLVRDYGAAIPAHRLPGLIDALASHLTKPEGPETWSAYNALVDLVPTLPPALRDDACFRIIEYREGSAPADLLWTMRRLRPFLEEGIKGRLGATAAKLAVDALPLLKDRSDYERKSGLSRLMVACDWSEWMSPASRTQLEAAMYSAIGTRSPWDDSRILDALLRLSDSSAPSSTTN